MKHLISLCLLGLVFGGKVLKPLPAQHGLERDQANLIVFHYGDSHKKEVAIMKEVATRIREDKEIV